MLVWTIQWNLEWEYNRITVHFIFIIFICVLSEESRQGYSRCSTLARAKFVVGLSKRWEGFTPFHKISNF